MDAHANFAYSTVATPPSPASSGLSLVLATGTGTRFPDPAPFNVVVWPEGEIALPENAEIARVSDVSGDTVTLSARAQEGSTARAIVAGDQIAAMITKKTLTDIEGSTGEWLSVYRFSTVQPVNDVLTAFVFDTADDPPQTGTGLAWDPDTPDRVTVAKAGRYDVSAKLVLNNNTADIVNIVLVELLIHNDDAGPGYSYDMFDLKFLPNTDPMHAPFFAVFSIPGVVFEAGEIVKLVAKAQDSQGGKVNMIEGVLTISGVGGGA